MEPVATIRCIKFDSYYKLGCLVVRKEYRSLKLGRKLVEALHAYVKDDARKQHAVATQGSADEDLDVRIVAYSQLHAVPFYSK